jgi:hypothetical protein
VRQVLHGEHAGCYAADQGNHYLVDGDYKYIWYSQTGCEQFFDLRNDPRELRDLALVDNAEVGLQVWRQRLVNILRGRPEGCVDEDRLVPGKPHEPLLPGYDPNAVYPFL